MDLAFYPQYNFGVVAATLHRVDDRCALGLRRELVQARRGTIGTWGCSTMSCSYDLNAQMIV